MKDGIPTCPDCGGPMHLESSAYGRAWECDRRVGVGGGCEGAIQLREDDELTELQIAEAIARRTLGGDSSAHRQGQPEYHHVIGPLEEIARSGYLSGPQRRVLEEARVIVERLASAAALAKDQARRQEKAREAAVEERFRQAMGLLGPSLAPDTTRLEASVVDLLALARFGGDACATVPDILANDSESNAPAGDLRVPLPQPALPGRVRGAVDLLCRQTRSLGPAPSASRLSPRTMGHRGEGPLVGGPGRGLLARCPCHRYRSGRAGRGRGRAGANRRGRGGVTFSHAKKSLKDYGAGYRDELERFKTAINLTEYAASQGYQLDKRASSRNSVVMRHPAGDKVVIARGEDQHWIYFSVRDESDNGSIIDFIQYRRRCSLADVRRELRPWVGGAVPRPALELYVPEVVPVSRDRAGVIRALAAMKPLVTHRYLQEQRAIPRELFAHPRFAGKVLVDARSNVIFPHADQDGPCGYEIKNRNFTGFAPGGQKGLWVSRVKHTDTALVHAESGIDAISYAVMHPDENTRYASFGGAFNSSQPLLVRAAINRLPLDGAILIATDNDDEGDDFALAITKLVRQVGRDESKAHRVLPDKAKDWSEVLLRRANCLRKPEPRTLLVE